MADIFQEVDEAIQKEKFEKIWHDHKEKIVAAILALIIATGGISFYKNWDEKRDGDDTARLLNVLGPDITAEKIGAISNDTRGGIATIGNFLSAGLQLEAGKNVDAVKTYESIISENYTPAALEDLARVLKSQYNDDIQSNLNTLKPLLADQSSPFHWHAKLQAATIEAENNNFDTAISHLKSFEETDKVSATLKQRADAMLHVYQIKQSQKKNEEL